jgi:integrase
LAAQAQTEGDRAACISVLDAYLTDVEAHRKPSTYSLCRRMLQAFCKELGAVRVRDLKPHQVSAWLTKMETPRTHKTRGLVKWGPGTRRTALTALNAGFNWAVRQGLISKNPVAGMAKPGPRSRAADQLLKEEQHQQILKVAPPRFLEYLIALNDTGARPGEVARVTAADFQEQIGAWVLADHKTDHTGKKRVIYLTPKVIEMVRRLSARHPEGPLFRNRIGRPWTCQSLSYQFRRLRKLLPLGRVSAYSYRHKFATEFLLKGGSLAYVAELQGNSVAMIEHHYGHLREHGTVLRNALLAFRGDADDAAPQERPRPSGG